MKIAQQSGVWYRNELCVWVCVWVHTLIEMYFEVNVDFLALALCNKLWFSHIGRIIE